MLRCFGALATFLCVLCFSAIASAQFARQEVHVIPSVELSLNDFLTGKNGTPITIAAMLRLPKAGAKQPAVILVHGAGGLGSSRGYIELWSNALNEAGYATFIVDGWSGRGIVNIAADTYRVSDLSRVAEAYRALDYLSKHAMIDSSRIAIMGFSHGGPSALYSGLARFQQAHGAQNKFAAHISVYGPCDVAYKDDENFSAPLLMLHGSADDWVSPGPCRDYAARLTKAGRNVRYVEYPGALHAFDAIAIKEPMKVAQGLTTRRCRLVEGADGTVVNTESGQPHGPSDPCLERGTTIGYNEAATRAAMEEVKAFLKPILAK